MSVSFSAVIRFRLGLFAVFLAGSVLVEAQPPAQMVYKLNATIAKVHALLDRDVVPNVPGFAAAAMVDGELVWSEAFGYAHRVFTVYVK